MRQKRFGSFLFPISVGAFVLAASVPGMAQIPQEGPYVTADVGAAFVGDITGTIGDLHGTLKFDTGVRGSVGVGYILHSSSVYEAAVQLETGLLYSSSGDARDPDGYSHSTDGNLYQVPVLADIIYRFRVGDRFVPYLGIGGGGAYSRVHLDKIDDYLVDYTTDSFSFAAQALAGVNYKLNERTELGVGYKYLANFAEVDYIGTHSFSLLFFYRF